MSISFLQKLTKVDNSGHKALGNLVDVYASPRDGQKLITFVGVIEGKKMFRCPCNPFKLYSAGDHFQNVENHMSGPAHFETFRRIAFDDNSKNFNAWLAFAAGNPKSGRSLRTAQTKKRKIITDAKRGFALDLG